MCVEERDRCINSKCRQQIYPGNGSSIENEGGGGAKEVVETEVVTRNEGEKVERIKRIQHYRRP